jgi:hypothetical protein
MLMHAGVGIVQMLQKSPLEIAVCIFTTEQVPGAFTTKVSKLWNTAIETDF